VDVAPRLTAAGADLERVHLVVEHFVLPAHLHRLLDLAVEIGDVGMLLIDPLSNHMEKADSNAETAVRFRDRRAEPDGGRTRLLHPRCAAPRQAPAERRACVRARLDRLVFHVQVVAGNRSGRSAAQSYRIELRDVPGLAEPVTYAVALGESSKSVDDLLASVRHPSRSDDARNLILDVLEDEGDQESDALDARVAQATGLAAKTVKNQRAALRDEG
jgi:hypothetical protein